MHFSKLFVWILMMFVVVGVAKALLTDDLYAYYDFDTNVTYDSSGNDRDGTAVGNAHRITTNTALGEGCYYGDGNGDAIDIDVAKGAIELTYNATMCLWYNISGGTVVILGSEDDADPALGVAYITVPGSGGYPVEFYVVPNGGGASKMTSNITSEGAWTFLCVDWNGTHTNTYVNGSRSNSSEWALQTDNNDGGEKFYIGAGGFGGAPASSVLGSLDEVGIWNRSLSDEEIEYLWNGSSGCNPTTGFCDPAPPNSAPTFDEDLQNQSIENNTAWTWDVNCSDVDGDIIQYHINSTFITIDNDTGMMNVTTLDAGNWTNIGVFCNDSEDESWQVFDYESLPQPLGPYLTITEPDNETTENTTLNVHFTYNDFLEFPGNCSLMVNATLRQNIEDIPHGTELELNWTAMTEGNWTWYLECTNNESLGANSSDYIFYYDNIAPIITSNLYVNDTTIFNDSLEIQFNFSDENLYLVNLTDIPNGGNYTWNATGISGSIYVHNETFSLENHSGDVNIMEACACDGHTAATISEWNNQIVSNIIQFDNNKFSIAPKIIEDYSSASYEKYSDRYNFNFYRKEPAKENVFVVSSIYPIDIVEGSNYVGHLIIPDIQRWIDFEGIGHTAAIKRISENQVEVIITTQKATDKLYFHSAGELNCVEYSYAFFNGNPTEQYPSNPVEGETVNFAIDFTYNSSWVQQINMSTDVNTFFYYNHTLYNASKHEYSNHYNFSNSITLGESSAFETWNNTFQWNYTVIGPSDQILEEATTERTLNIYSFSLLDCALGGEPIINITNYEERNRTLHYFEVDAIIDAIISGTINKSYNFSFTSSSNNSICISPGFGNMTANVTFYYSNESDNFDSRIYYALNQLLSNETENISLYLTFDDITTDVYFRVYDIYYNPIPEILVKAQRFYSDEGVYRTVEQSKSGWDGVAFLNLEEKIVDYQFVFSDGNTTRLTSSRMRVNCKDPTTYKCVIDFTLGEDTVDYLTAIEGTGVTYNFSWDNETKVITFFFDDAAGATSSMMLEVFQTSPDGSEDVLCNTTLSSSSGSITCNLSAYNTGSFTARSTRSASPESFFASFTWRIDEFWKTFGTEGLFWGLIFEIAMACIGAFSAGFAVIMVIFGFIMLYFLNITSLGWGLLCCVIALGVVVLFTIIRRGSSIE